MSWDEEVAVYESHHNVAVFYPNLGGNLHIWTSQWYFSEEMNSWIMVNHQSVLYPKNYTYGTSYNRALAPNNGWDLYTRYHNICTVRTTADTWDIRSFSLSISWSILGNGIPIQKIFVGGCLIFGIVHVNSHTCNHILSQWLYHVLPLLLWHAHYWDTVLYWSQKCFLRGSSYIELI